MRLSIFRRRITNNNHLFNAQYLDPKALFVCYFDALPNMSYITQVDVNKAYAWIRSQVNMEVLDTYQHSVYNRESGNTEFNVTFLVLSNRRLIEVGGDYVSFYHSPQGGQWVQEMLQELAQFVALPSQERTIGFATRQAVEN